MFVRLNTSMFTGRVKDEEVSQEVSSMKNADEKSGAWWTYLIPKHATKSIWAARTLCRKLHLNMTLPWNDDGSRILPSELFMDYTQKMRAAKAQYDEAVEAFLTEYPTIRSTAKDRLGKLWKDQTLPSTDELRERFRVGTVFYPLPDTGDFRVDLPAADIHEIQRQMEEQVGQVMKTAMMDVWNRLRELIVKVNDTMKEPEKVFRDSLFTNLQEFCELVPKLNIVGDNNLEEARTAIVTMLKGLKPEEIRADKKKRKTVSKNAKQVLDKIDDFFK
jgi:hypothetical protein